MNADSGEHASSLPAGDCPTLALVEPTEDEKVSQWIKNGSEWRGALPLDAYLGRERHLASQDFTRDGGQTWWALVDTAASERTLLASCDTWRKKAVVAKDGQLKDVIAHGIGSVFSAPEFRGKGYAGRMMQELAKKLKTWQTEENGECLFTILYSDIGKKFYAKHGWEPFPSTHVSLPATAEQAPVAATLPAVKDLIDADLPGLCAADERQLRRSLAQSPSDGKTRIALVPDIQTIRWHQARENFVGKELYGKQPEAKGAIVGEEEGKRVWCYWAHLWYNPDKEQSESNVLYILRLVVEDGVALDAAVPAVAALLARAQREAASWRLAEVEAWSPTPEVAGAARLLDPSNKVIEREAESITSLMWYGEPQQAGRSIVDSFKWVANEKFGWC